MCIRDRIYAIYNVPEGPSPTKFIIESDIVNSSGRVIEPEPIEKFDEGFGISQNIMKVLLNLVFHYNYEMTYPMVIMKLM